MPEGPSIVILKEHLQPFAGQTIRQAGGNTRAIALPDLSGQTITAFKSWGKHLLICLPSFTLKIHLMLFGSYTINTRKENRAPRLSLQFDTGEINFYACAVSRLDAVLDEIYDWSCDVMNPVWDNDKALQKLLSHPEKKVADALLDQQIFSGSGNIIKNEVLFLTRIHPESLLGSLPIAKLQELIAETVSYSYRFYSWRKAFELKKHWQVYRQRICPRDGTLLKNSVLGKTRRRTYYCPACQHLYE